MTIRMRGLSCTRLGNMSSSSFGPQLFTFLLCLTLVSVEGEWSRYCPATSERTIAQGICGSRLSNIVRDICRTYGYNSQRIYKKDAAPPKETVEPLGGPFISKAVAYSYLQKRHLVSVDGQTFRQGIVCECCVNRCGLSELREYCAPPDTALLRKRGLQKLLNQPKHQITPANGETRQKDAGSQPTEDIKHVFSGQEPLDLSKSSSKSDKTFKNAPNMDKNERKEPSQRQDDMELDLKELKSQVLAEDNVEFFNPKDTRYTDIHGESALIQALRSKLGLIRNGENHADKAKKNVRKVKVLLKE